MATISKEDLNEFVEDTDQANYQLNLIKSKIKVKPNESFLLMFSKNLLNTMVEYGLNNTDVKVLLKVCYYVSFGNVINLTQQTIADELNLTQQQVSKGFKNLENG